MGNPGAQHEYACTVVHKYPRLALRLGEIAAAKIPEHDLVVASPNTHQLRGRKPLETDGTARFLLGGEPVYFAQVEVQNKHTLDKYATLRAYHGSEVSTIRTGGHMIMVSPKASEAEKFRRSEEYFSEEYAYRGSCLSREDLEPLTGEDRPFEERAFAEGMTDFDKGVPESACAMLRELFDRDVTLADLFVRAIMEEVPDVSMVGGLVDPDLYEKFRQLPVFSEYTAEVEEAAAKAEARAKKAEAEVEAAAAKSARDTVVAALTRYFAVRGDKLSASAYNQISACQDAGQLQVWLDQAYEGATAAEIFPEP
jgi:hypothetical protein